MGVIRYDLHVVLDGRDIAHPIPDAHAFLRAQALLRWRALPFRKRFTEAGVAEAIEAALDDAVTALHHASLRV